MSKISRRVDGRTRESLLAREVSRESRGKFLEENE